MRFLDWLFHRPDPYVEAMREKVARNDQAIESGEAALQAEIHRTNGAFVRMENRTAMVKRRVDERFLADLTEGWGGNNGQ